MISASFEFEMIHSSLPLPSVRNDHSRKRVEEGGEGVEKSGGHPRCPGVNTVLDPCTVLNPIFPAPFPLFSTLSHGKGGGQIQTGGRKGGER